VLLIAVFTKVPNASAHIYPLRTLNCACVEVQSAQQATHTACKNEDTHYQHPSMKDKHNQSLAPLTVQGAPLCNCLICPMHLSTVLPASDSCMHNCVCAEVKCSAGHAHSSKNEDTHYQHPSMKDETRACLRSRERANSRTSLTGIV